MSDKENNRLSKAGSHSVHAGQTAQPPLSVGQSATVNLEQGTDSEKSRYLQIDNVSKEYDGYSAVKDVSLTISQGEIFALVGASGCGKSTLLRMLAGFEMPSQGKIILDNQELGRLPPYKRPINMMFQSYALFPHMTVANNIAFGLRQSGADKAEIRDKVGEMLKLVQMEKFAKRKPHQLSGGQQQRVALARSLVKSPKLLLLDEPMGALDKKLRTQMQLEIACIIERLGVTCMMVTHDQEEAMTMACRIAIMDAGKIKQVGKPNEIYEQPNCRFTAEFIGIVNIFDGKLDKHDPKKTLLTCPALPVPVWIGQGLTGLPGMPCSIALRPEKIRITDVEPEQAFNKAQGIIDDIAYLGSHSIYHILLKSGQDATVTVMNAERLSSKQFTWNDAVWIFWEEQAGVVITQ